MKVLLVLMIAFSTWHFSGFESQIKPATELTTVSGGACSDCTVKLGICLVQAAPCQKVAANLWAKRDGFPITPALCFVVAPKAPGYTECSTKTPEVCTKTYSCTAAGCAAASCGPPTIAEEDTICTLTGKRCKG